MAEELTPFDAYRAAYAASIADPEGFWASAATRLTWFAPWRRVLEWDFTTPRIAWFLGGTLNASVNCLDRHVAAGNGDRVAIRWQGNELHERHAFTYRELLAEVERAAGMLKSLGVTKGDRVAIYLQMIPELPIAMLACARIGAIHSVIFGAFSGDSVRARIADAGCRVLITQDTAVRGAKQDIPMKENADRACVDPSPIEHIVVIRRTGVAVPMRPGRDVWWDDAMAHAPAHCPPEAMDAEDPLFILYTSGSTGKPKGVLHTTGGYLVYAALTFVTVFDYRPGEVFWCTADCGWITGHSYVVYGPLANGATVLLYEGVPNYPDFGRYWQVIEEYRVAILYTAPTALRALMKEGDTWPRRYDRSSLRILGTVGEPIKSPEWHWYRDVIGGGRCPVIDTWWQTETGGHMITPIPGVTPLKPGSATFPFFGIRPVLLDDAGALLEGPASGNLAIAFPWPGMMRTVWGDHERFRQTYFERFPGYYCTGDGARRDADGYYWITGRVDDIIIVSGHNLGTAEIEGAIGAHPAIAEAAVVGVSHPITGQAVYAYVTPKTGADIGTDFADAIRAIVRERIGPHAVPAVVQIAYGLPKTRSGKIMRRILRGIAGGATDDFGDLSTLADPAVVAALVEGRISVERPLDPAIAELQRLVMIESPTRADAIIWLQGNGYDRGTKVLQLYRDGFAPRIVITGNSVRRVGHDSVTVPDCVSWLRTHGVSDADVIVDNAALHTHDQSVFGIGLAVTRQWNTLLLVASPHHQLRAFLTFLKEAQRRQWTGRIVNQPVDIPWDACPSGRTQTTREAFGEEIEKLKKYGDHVASVAEGVAYARTFHTS